ncbi:MAG: HEAT repeat domain-containing protein [Cyanobacteria bacterium J06638_28]
MSHRFLLLALIYLATWGMSSKAIAQRELTTVAESTGTPDLLISQADPDDEASGPQPSESMANLQGRLAELGYYNGPIDGFLNPDLLNALVQFQEDMGLVGTGMLDNLTAEKLRNPDPTALPSAANGDASTQDADSPEPNILGEESSETSGSPTEIEPLPTSEDGSDPATLDNADPELLPEVEDGTSTSPDGNLLENPTLNSEGDTAPAETNPDASEQPEQAADSSAIGPEGGLLRLALIGLGIVIVGGLGGTALLILARRGKSDAEIFEAPEGEAIDDEIDHFHPAEALEAVTEPVPTHVEKNGKGQSAPVSKPETVVNTPSLTTTSPKPATPRLARVNIIDELIQDLEDPDPTIRRKAIWELGQRGNSAAVTPLVGLMIKVDSHEQSLILAALAEISTQTLKPLNRALAVSLQNENPEVRKNAIRDLTRIYDLMGQAGRILGHATSDEDADVRQTANWALNQLDRMRLKATESTPRLQDGSTTARPLSGEETSSSKL